MSKDLFILKREFLEYCELDKGQSSLTIANYDRYLSKFLDWLRPRKTTNGSPHGSGGSSSIPEPKQTIDLLPIDITQESIREYKLHVNRLSDKNGRELKKTTQNYHFLAIRAFLRYLAFRGIQSLSPEKISVAKTGDREVTFLESEELGQILNTIRTESATGIRDRVILEVLFSTGMRVSEVAGLNTDDINYERGEIAVLGKGKKLRVVFLSESAVHWLQEYLKVRQFQAGVNPAAGAGEPLLLSPRGGHLTVRTIERIVERAAKKAGITKNVSPHTLRHSFATDLLMSGADIRSVQSLLGHSSITTTQVYTHVTDQHLREVHQAFHGRSLMKEEENLVGK